MLRETMRRTTARWVRRGAALFGTTCLGAALLVPALPAYAQDPCPISPPSSLSCAQWTEGDQPTQLTWVNEDTYDAVHVIVNGYLAAELPGDSESYVDSTAVDGHLLTFTIEAVSDADDCTASSESCELPFGVGEACTDFLGATAFVDDPVSETFEIPSEHPNCPGAMELIEVSVEISTLDSADLHLEITSDDGVTVVLAEMDSFTGEDLRVRFSDDGEPVDDSACGCLVPAVGVMDDFVNTSDPGGFWVLDLSTVGADAELEEFCIHWEWDASVISAASGLFLRGDVDGNGTVSVLSDAFYFFEWMFGSNPEPPCLAAADADGNGIVNVFIDMIYLFNWAFLNGPQTPPPGPYFCGTGGSSPLSCDSWSCLCF